MNLPVDAVVAPTVDPLIAAPSIVPPLISAFEVIKPPVNVDKPVTSSVLPSVVAPFALNVPLTDVLPLLPLTVN